MNKSVLLVLAGAILWGTTGTAQALAPEAASPLVIGALRLLIGGGALFVFISFTGRLKLGTIPKKALLISALAMALYQPFFFIGVDLTGVAIGTVVAICSAPMFAGILEGFFYKKLPDRTWIFSTLLAITGCTLIFQGGGQIVFEPSGMVYALLAGLSFATYTLVSKSLVEQYPSDVVVALIFSTAAIFLLPILFVSDLSWVLEVDGALSVFHLGILATAIAYIVFARGLKGVVASHAVTLALAEPLTAVLLGVFILGESLSVVSFTGLLLIVSGLVILSTQARRRRTQT
ncbi:DMT family transporter [Halalkalibacillus halophilus]|uniref:DMT family transporter n=1 Tax=Halalkalibacillus halophilus TaxID=392827 RepID=UPI000409C21B|nr:EamA family transporter [Halalkalibacillus halophilus]